jgi:hypothetical protein
MLKDSIITLAALDILESEMVIAKNTERKYELLFGQKDGRSNVGGTIKIRKPPRYAVRSGAAFSASDIGDESVDFSIGTQIGIDTELTSVEMAQDLSSFTDQVLKPQISRLAHAIDVAVATAAYQAATNFVGVPGTTPTDIDTYLEAGAVLDRELAPRDGQRIAAIGPTQQQKLVKAASGLFQNDSKISKQYDSGEMGSALGLRFNMSQNVQTHTVGTLAAGALVNGAGQTGATVNVDGAGATTWNKGDKVQFAGCYAVHPITKANLGVLRVFTVTAQTAAVAGAAALPISPSIVTSGVTQNCTASPTDNGAVTVFGHATNYSALVAAQGLVWHKSAIALGFQELPMPRGAEGSTKTDKKLGISLRLVRQYDIDTDKHKCRFDVFYGTSLVRPEWVVPVQGGAL